MYRILKKKVMNINNMFIMLNNEYGISSFKTRVPNQKSNPKLIFVFPIQSICCGYSKE